MTATEKIIAYFNDNDDVLTEVIEELDSWNGYLGDDRYYDMDLLSEFYHGCDLIELLNRAYFGKDLDNWYIDSRGDKRYESFNPNRNYFTYNGYGNLVSSDYRDYSDHNDEYLINTLCENRQHIDSIDENDELKALFDELDGTAFENAFDEFCRDCGSCDECCYSKCKTMTECKEAFKRDHYEEV